MTRALGRRLNAIERHMGVESGPLGPCFIMSSDTEAAERHIARLKAEFSERLPRTLFVMTLVDREDRGQ